MTSTSKLSLPTFSMIRKLQRENAVELFRRIYADSNRRTLVIDDGSASGWKETDSFPRIGDCELLIKDIQVPENLRVFIAVLRDYYANKTEETFFYFEEEYVAGRERIQIECDLSALSKIVNLVDDGPNFNAVLFDAPFSWALKLHHESFGYFSGDKSICNLLRSSDLANLIRDPVWI